MLFSERGSDMSDEFHSRQRFSDRVANYVRHRPGYPEQVMEILREEFSLPEIPQVADVGSGTGIFSSLLLQNGFEVFAVEPNAPMRQAAEQALAGQPFFHSLDGSAEQTGLGDHSVDLVCAAQAFHWFDLPAARREFGRILRPEYPVILIWNDRKLDSTPFLQAYESLLLDFGTDYQVLQLRMARLQAGLETFFAPGTCRCRTLENRQQLDESQFIGRALSSSYLPGAGHPRHNEVTAQLKALFARHAVQGTVEMDYTVTMFLGQVPPDA
jgi:SAM-dependent methyltransferase